MDIKELLPIGSIVLLKKGQKRLMIFGIKQMDANTKEEYDYIGVLYPEGNMGEVGQFLFNSSDIDQVYFRGYEDSERTEFIEALDEFYKNGGGKGI
ncbi:MAG: DUF4176 domain-containing protein [Clostridiales bacterium]|nr:DUF4176 domain-containing protein [Clostridiales bacterium]